MRAWSAVNLPETGKVVVMSAQYLGREEICSKWRDCTHVLFGQGLVVVLYEWTRCHHLDQQRQAVSLKPPKPRPGRMFSPPCVQTNAMHATGKLLSEQVWSHL